MPQYTNPARLARQQRQIVVTARRQVASDRSALADNIVSEVSGLETDLDAQIASLDARVTALEP